MRLPGPLSSIETSRVYGQCVEGRLSCLGGGGGSVLARGGDILYVNMAGGGADLER